MLPLLHQQLHAYLRAYRPSYRFTPPARITLDSQLKHDIGLDFLGFLELVQWLEQTYAIHLPEAELLRLDTVRDVVRCVERCVLARQPFAWLLPAPGLN